MPAKYYIDIGGEQTEVCRHFLGASEAAFILRTTRQRVQGRWTMGLLPFAHVAGRRRTDASELAARLLEAEDWLAVEFLRAWCEGRYEAPVPKKADEFPPDLADCLEYLDRPFGSASSASVVSDTVVVNGPASVSLSAAHGSSNDTPLAEGGIR